jgi:hypothetical protein
VTVTNIRRVLPRRRLLIDRAGRFIRRCRLHLTSSKRRLSCAIVTTEVRVKFISRCGVIRKAFLLSELFRQSWRAMGASHLLHPRRRCSGLNALRPMNCGSLISKDRIISDGIINDSHLFRNN